MSSHIDVPPGGVTRTEGAAPADVPARSSDRGAATRGALLAAARDVFCESGFAQAAVTDIVAKAGASVGSLYHHFSGKADLYLTLYENFQNSQQVRTRQAINAVREAGVTDPMQQFLAGATAYFDGCIKERDVARLFISGDGPPGFDRVMRQRLGTWARRNAALFNTADGGVDEALVMVLTGAMAGAVSEVSLMDDEDAARRLADEIVAILGTIRNPRTGHG
ncbi:TetR family transcriptional regulator [Actinomadura pelletieri DSM 43383]|uniref:TetR family transcriptional regulator n=1 Tax=Actinomadura pelletieri DSM 43383 TaxID=1120940 RepID=A0A495QIP2_9ACTN|nr:TetR/AcrR family transcriptional regulator [Actinomadura pelletieri]RKS72001.1 TetR family transcriptional regulator [Actinomadura pelletieri DSM 43383]